VAATVMRACEDALVMNRIRLWLSGVVGMSVSGSG